MNTLKKRLIGTDDIAFDDAGTGVKDSYVSKDGKEYKVKRLNASDIPVTAERRNQYNGASNIDTALKRVKEQVDSFKSEDFMQSDKTIQFGAEETIEEIKYKINSEKKNLGGFTLEFVFPESLDQKLSETLVFEDFFNGTLIIRGGSETLLSGIYDLADIGSLFEVRNCLCSVEISNFTFVHQFSKYGIYLRGSLYIFIKNCTFTGNGESTGVLFDGSDGKFDNCIFYDDTDMEVTGAVVNKLRSESSEKYLPLAGGEMTGVIYVPVNGGIRTKHGKDVFLLAGSAWMGSARIILRGQESEVNPGGVEISASSSDGDKILSIYTDGRIKFDKKDVELVDSIGDNYIRLASGLQICFGQSEGNKVITLPKPFVTNGYQISLTDVGQDTHAGGAGNRTTTTFKIFSASEVYFHWIAIGKWK